MLDCISDISDHFDVPLYLTCCGNKSFHEIKDLIVKLHGHRLPLPGERNTVLIVPLDPAYPALAGRGTSRPRENCLLQQAHSLNSILFAVGEDIISYVLFGLIDSEVAFAEDICVEVE